MEYNFETIIVDLIEKFNKKMDTQRKLANKNLAVIFDFLGDKLPNDRKKELKITIDDMLSDAATIARAQAMF